MNIRTNLHAGICKEAKLWKLQADAMDQAVKECKAARPPYWSGPVVVDPLPIGAGGNIGSYNGFDYSGYCG
ncbi:MAG: hypothetical protein ACKOC5_15725 [Chloroflexota bacterium]